MIKITEATTLGELAAYLVVLGSPFVTLMRGPAVGERYAIIHSANNANVQARGSFYGTGMTEAEALEAAISGLRRAMLPEPLRAMLDEPVDPLCSQCRKPRVLNEWPRGFCKVECERAFYEARGDRISPCHGCSHAISDHPNDSGCQRWHANADGGESEHDQYDRATGDLGRPLLLENDPPAEAYEGSFCEAADNEGARIAAADREGGEE